MINLCIDVKRIKTVFEIYMLQNSKVQPAVRIKNPETNRRDLGVIYRDGMKILHHTGHSSAHTSCSHSRGIVGFRDLRNGSLGSKKHSGNG